MTPWVRYGWLLFTVDAARTPLTRATLKAWPVRRRLTPEQVNPRSTRSCKTSLIRLALLVRGYVREELRTSPGRPGG